MSSKGRHRKQKGGAARPHRCPLCKLYGGLRPCIDAKGRQSFEKCDGPSQAPSVDHARLAAGDREE